MPFCPECGGEMKHDPYFRRYICKSCGLSLTSQEIMELRDKMRQNTGDDDDKRKQKRKEYLDWWFSRKG